MVSLAILQTTRMEPTKFHICLLRVDDIKYDFLSIEHLLVFLLSKLLFFQVVLLSKFFNLKLRQGTATKNSFFDCSFTGELVTNQIVAFLVQSMDEFGNLIRIGGEHFRALIVGPEILTPFIQDNRNGTYTVNVMPSIPGDYSLEISLDPGENTTSIPIAGNPCSFTVNTCAYDPANSFVYRSSLLGSRSCDFSNFFTIQGVDECGSFLQKGGETFDFSFAEPNGTKCSSSKNDLSFLVVDNQNGTYSVLWNPTVAGEYFISISSNNVSLQGSPYRVIVDGGNVFSFGTYT